MTQVNLPDYLSDLNAMHSAEKILNRAQCNEYNHTLFHLDSWSEEDDFPAQNIVWHAIASQRAEAFLKALNLWDDSK